MALKKSFLNLDHRHLMLPVVFLPFTLWIAAIIIGFLFWRQRGLLIAAGLFFLGGWIARKIPTMEYWLARRALPQPIPGTAGTDYVLFNAEDPATMHKLKLFSEDSGFLYADDHSYRLQTLLHDYQIPFENFQQEFYQHQGEIKGIHLRFQPVGSAQTLELAISCIYPGNDMEIAGSIAKKNQWGSKAITALNRRKTPPPLPPGTTATTSPA